MIDHLSNDSATYNQPVTRLAAALLISMRMWKISYTGER
jgi:hypothetical protein